MTYLHGDAECAEYHGLVRDFGGPRPDIVCLCGSTRFYDAFGAANLRLTIAGSIVLSIGCDTRSDDDLSGIVDTEELKEKLDELHKRKIDLADEVYVLNIDGYIGESTCSEIEYARRIGKPVRYLLEDSPEQARSVACGRPDDACGQRGGTARCGGCSG